MPGTGMSCALYPFALPIKTEGTRHKVHRSGSSPFEDHRHPAPRPQAEHRPGLDRGPGARRRRNDWAIMAMASVASIMANSWPMHWCGPPRNGIPGEPRPAGRALGEEAVGVERLGVGPELGVTVGHVRAEDDHRPRRDVIAADLVVGHARRGPRRRPADRAAGTPRSRGGCTPAAAGRRPWACGRRGRRRPRRGAGRSASGCRQSR